MEIPSPELQFAEAPRPCSYLPEETASLEYRFYSGLSPGELEELVRRGWRRFGTTVFRPACQACRECVPLRVEVNRFQESKSQRRTRRKNAHIHVQLSPATVSAAHVALYNTWHLDMTERRDWKEQATTSEEYWGGFLSGRFPSAWEMRYFREETLVGVGLIDLLPHSLSSIYFYHAPDWRPDGPGTFSMLCEIDLARQRQLEFVYLGYWIRDCQSMAYKNRFVPHELLRSRPKEQAEPDWQRVEFS